MFSFITVRPSQLDVHAVLSDRESKHPCQLQLKTVHDHFLKSIIKTHKTGELGKYSCPVSMPSKFVMNMYYGYQAPL